MWCDHLFSSHQSILSYRRIRAVCMLGFFLLMIYLVWHSVCKENAERRLLFDVSQSWYLRSPAHHPSKYVSRVTEQHRLLAKKLNLLEDDDPVLSTPPGNECTLDFINSQQLQQNHPCVIETIRRRYLHPPAERDVPYNLDAANVADPSKGQAVMIREHLQNQTNGFYVECGAYDGEHVSNTLFMERYLNWTGVLIEADQGAFGRLLARRRKAFTLPVCLSLVPYPTSVQFNQLSQKNQAEGTIYHAEINYRINKSEIPGQVISAQCFPLYSILLAVGRTSVDFFSLDVEGFELPILKTIPWHKVDIKTMTIEWQLVAEEPFIEFLGPLGYYVFARNEVRYNEDLLFAKTENLDSAIPTNS